MRLILLAAAAATLAATVTLAAEAPAGKAPAAGAPPPPPAPPEQPETGLEPEVTITTRGDTRYEEYRVNGRLYMVKVTPAKGAPYYLIDAEGKGQFRRSDLEPAIAIPNWVIKRW